MGCAIARTDADELRWLAGREANRAEPALKFKDGGCACQRQNRQPVYGGPGPARRWPVRGKEHATMVEI